MESDPSRGTRCQNQRKRTRSPQNRWSLSGSHPGGKVNGCWLQEPLSAGISSWQLLTPKSPSPAVPFRCHFPQALLVCAAGAGREATANSLGSGRKLAGVLPEKGKPGSARRGQSVQEGGRESPGLAQGLVALLGQELHFVSWEGRRPCWGWEGKA